MYSLFKQMALKRKIIVYLSITFALQFFCHQSELKNTYLYSACGQWIEYEYNPTFDLLCNVGKRDFPNPRFPSIKNVFIERVKLYLDNGNFAIK